MISESESHRHVVCLRGRKSRIINIALFGRKIDENQIAYYDISLQGNFCFHGFTKLKVLVHIRYPIITHENSKQLANQTAGGQAATIMKYET